MNAPKRVAGQRWRANPFSVVFIVVARIPFGRSSLVHSGETSDKNTLTPMILLACCSKSASECIRFAHFAESRRHGEEEVQRSGDNLSLDKGVLKAVIEKNGGARRASGGRELADQQWALDFAHDAAESGRKFRVLSVIDVYTRTCLPLEVDTRFASRRVTRELERIVAARQQLKLREQVT